MTRLIPFGRFHPDAEGINAAVVLKAANVRPVAAGFAPFRSAVSVGDSLGSQVRGAVSRLDSTGNVISFAGTETALKKLGSGHVWSDVSRVSGGAYSTTAPERWRFGEYGSYIIATNYVDDVQAWQMGVSSNFAALGGSPPKARYIGIVRDFVVLGNLVSDNKAIHWSAVNDATGWTVGTASSDVQSFPDGGPIQGIIGGEVGYIFQREAVTRMTFVPGSGEIFQFDEVESGRGLFAPDSLVHNASEAFYVGVDSLYRMNLASGVSRPIGVGKFRDWFVADMEPDSQSLCFGALAPQMNLYCLAYVSRDNVTKTSPDRMLVYDWAIDEAAFVNITANTLTRWLSQGVDLDSMDSFGDLDSLELSLDAPFWKGGAPLLSVFQDDNKIAYFNGSNMAAEFVTADGQVDGRRQLITGTRPHIDCTGVTVEVAGRERDGDTISYAAAESMEDTGEVPAWVSGNYCRARITVAAGESWTYAKGIDTMSQDMGSR
jgi:hypothetical protein